MTLHGPFVIIVPARSLRKAERDLPEAKRTAEIRISLNLEALAQTFGVKAVRNKSKRSTLAHGDIVFEAFNIRQEAE